MNRFILDKTQSIIFGVMLAVVFIILLYIHWVAAIALFFVMWANNACILSMVSRGHRDG